MAGHSQFKNIMYRKGAQDAKRAKLFARISREITVAVKSGNADPKQNPRLRSAIINARNENMPNDKIKNAIQKGKSGENLSKFSEIRYEGYGPNGIAIIIEAITDNKNRTASEIRTILNKHGGALGEDGSVSFNFERVGKLVFSKDKFSIEDIIDAAIEAGALDYLEENELLTIITSIEKFGRIRDKLEKSFEEPIKAKLIWNVVNYIEVADAEAKKIDGLLEALDDNDDIQALYTNFRVKK